jgi:hypothetical protein
MWSSLVWSEKLIYYLWVYVAVRCEGGLYIYIYMFSYFYWFLDYVFHLICVCCFACLCFCFLFKVYLKYEFFVIMYYFVCIVASYFCYYLGVFTYLAAEGVGSGWVTCIVTDTVNVGVCVFSMWRCMGLLSVAWYAMFFTQNMTLETQLLYSCHRAHM